MTATTPLDSSMFKQDGTECSVEESKEGESIRKCDCLSRICYGLKYYELLLSSKQMKNGNDIFTEFCIQSYSQCVDEMYSHTFLYNNIHCELNALM